MGSGQRAADVSCYILGVIFSLSGIVKVYPVNRAVYQYMGTKFSEWKDVFPLAPLGLVPDPYLYQLSIGIAELGLGILISVGGQRVRWISGALISVIMAGAIQTLVCNGEATDIGPAVSCLLMSGFIVYQYRKNSNTKPKSS